MEATASQKAHRAPKSGVKASKKKAKAQKKNTKLTESSSQKKNLKAFTFNSALAANRAKRRNLDRDYRKHHVPIANRTTEPPPYLIAVVGPPGVGKSTLIKSLVKHFTKHNIAHVKGPITVIAGKQRRLTFFECPNELNSMVDLAKTADLVLLLVDASFGFEMEIFEFLNVLKTHGFPRVMGVLTHLDQFKQSKTLAKTKKKLKNRFWTEICDGAKLFYLSGLINRQYHKREIHNLARFISVIKFRPLVWRNTHPFVMADRFEDITDPAVVEMNPNADRTVSLYGYVRGTYLKRAQRIHLLGVGDFDMQDLSVVEDPLPQVNPEKKRLSDKEKRLYAPMSDVGDVMYGEDAVYINIKDTQVNFSKPSDLIADGDGVTGPKKGKGIANKLGIEEGLETDNLESKPVTLPEKQVGPGEQMVRELQDLKVALNDRLEESTIQIFKHSNPIATKDVQVSRGQPIEEEKEEVLEDEDSDTERLVGSKKKDEDVFERMFTKQVVDPRTGRVRNQVVFKHDAPGDDEDGEEVEEDEAMELQDEDAEPEANEEGEQGEDDEGDEGDQDAGEAVAAEEAEIGGEGETEESQPGLQWKANLAKRAAEKFERMTPLAELVYGDEKKNANRKKSAADKAAQEKAAKTNKAALKILQLFDDDDDEDEKSASKEEGKEQQDDQSSGSEDEGPGEDTLGGSEVESCRVHLATWLNLSGSPSNTSRWDDPEALEKLRNRFVTADWTEDGGEPAMVDLEAGSNGENKKGKKGGKSEDDDGFGDYDADGGDGGEGDEDDHGISTSDMMAGDEDENPGEAKAKLKEKFDRDYDRKKGKGDDDTGGGKAGEEEEDAGPTFFDQLKAEQKKQAEINEAEFAGHSPEERLRLQGARPGTYVRVQLEGVPMELCQHWQATVPLILGGLLPNEHQLGFLQIRVKKHRWHPKILKSNDPLVFSLGWRRFQSMPVYSIEDQTGRQRFLKYTPEHMHCMATIYGPITPPNTGIMAFRNTKSNVVTFRASLTGVVTELDQSVQIVKKLKLIGTAYKIYKNTAFIKDMFSTALEAAKFEGAKIRTVSGIRGLIKKAVMGGKGQGPEGAYRATFEDKILMSDIVFCRTWTKVTPFDYYNPVTSLLVDPSHGWRGMRTVAELRREQDLAIPYNKDSEYRPIERKPKVFNPLRIPKQIQRDLPFAAKPKMMKKRSSSKPTLDSLRAVVAEKADVAKYTLQQQLNTIRNEKASKAKVKAASQKKEFLKKIDRETAKHAASNKEQRKRRYVAEGKETKRRKEAEDGGEGGRGRGRGRGRGGKSGRGRKGDGAD